MAETTPDLTEVEMVEILKTIARDGRNGAARIAAIKELRAISGDGKPVEDGFAALDAGSKAGAAKLRAV